MSAAVIDEADAVVLTPSPLADRLLDLAEAGRQAASVAGRAAPALDLAARLGPGVPPPGGGRTGERWELLATLAANDLTAARVAEAHLDALAILSEAGFGFGSGARPQLPSTVSGTWGVFAAEAPGLRLDAAVTGSGWRLSGTKPWCSLGGRLDHALVTAHTDQGRRLFAVDLEAPGVLVHDPAGWVSRGLAEVSSVAIDARDVVAEPIGGAGWYLQRPGFAWGGLGVAACWYGGAVGVARRLLRTAREREPDQIALMHLGRVDVALAGARALLADAARDVDAGRADGAAGAVLANRVRSGVAAVADDVLARVARALGPAPLAFEDDHARRVADLGIYLRQHHGERDLAALGEAVLRGEVSAW